jgi:hypothetical protein
MEELELLWLQSKLDCKSFDPRNMSSVSKQRDITSINFDVRQADRSQKVTYNSYLVHDLSLQNLNVTGNSASLQCRLRSVLVVEYRVFVLQTDLAHGTLSRESPLYVVLNAIPRALHLETEWV